MTSTRGNQQLFICLLLVVLALLVVFLKQDSNISVYAPKILNLGYSRNFLQESDTVNNNSDTITTTLSWYFLSSATDHSNMENSPTAVSTPRTEELLDTQLIQGLPPESLFPCPDNKTFLCQYYQPDWKNKTDIEALMKSRMQSIRDRCKMYYPYMFNASLSTSHNNYKGRQKQKMMLTNRRLKLAFCWMPKMGSTFWKSAWRAINKAQSVASISQVRPYDIGASTVVSFFNKSQQNVTEANKYTSYAITRSPWERLVSVFREKCEGKKICSLPFGLKKCRVIPTFDEFVVCVLGMMAKETTEWYGHVDTTYARCGACDYPYDYIVYMENMVKEKEFIFKQAGVIDPVKAMNEAREKTIRPVEKLNKNISYTDFWRELSPELIDQVRFYFRYEIMLFDYPQTPFVIEPSS